jgi:ADP-heptose:LPS heptosyltransferase
MAALGCDTAFRRPALAPRAAAQTAAAARLASEAPGAGPLVVVHGGAGKLPNIWPADRFAAVTGALVRERGARIVLTEGPSDAAAMAALVPLVPGALRWQAPLDTTFALLSMASLVISNDTGLAHVAAALGTPTVVVFGPTDAARWCPPGEHVRAVRAPSARVQDVAVDDVLRAARGLLDGVWTRC